MHPLTRKMVRELWHNSVTLSVVVAIISIGTSSLVGLASAQRILEASQSNYYNEYQFADFWINVKKAPLTVVDHISKIPAVTKVEGRVVFDVILDLPDETRPVSGRLISTSAKLEKSQLNVIHLVRGSGFSDDRNEEVIISDAFAKAHHLDPGDRIHVILNKKRESFVIVGTAISPEYVYMVRRPGDLVPDPKLFGVLYMKEKYTREILGFKDSINQLTGRVLPGNLPQLDSLLSQIDRDLSAYGVLELIPRRRQASHRFLSDEIQGLKASATIMPAIFLGVAALVLNILMTRLAQRQRTTIGTLKAIGYSNTQIFIHYSSFGLMIGIIGGVLGILLGVLMTMGMIEVYKDFFQFPRFLFQIYPDLIAIGMVVSISFSVIGAMRGAFYVLELEPAEAMRPKPPEKGGKIFLEQFPAIWNSFSFRTQMALRSIFRNQIRTLTGIVASSLAISIIFMSMVLYDSFVYLVDYQFEKVSHSDVDISLREEASMKSLWQAKDLPGIDYAEPILGVMCDLSHGRYSRRMGITGLSTKHQLTTPRESGGAAVEIPETGLVLTRKLAEVLHVKVGETLKLRPIKGNRLTKDVRVSSIVDSFLGMDCYADLKYLSSIVGESLAVNSLQFSVDPKQMPALMKTVKSLPEAQGLNVRMDTKRNIEKTLVETSVFSIGIMVLFAGIIGFGSTLNNALIEIGDRIREISTLRVLGYQPVQIAGILFRQAMIIFVAGLLLSFPLGYLMIQGIVSAYDTELFRIPVVIRPVIVFYTISLAVSFILVAQILVYRQIVKLDFLEGVQVKE